MGFTNKLTTNWMENTINFMGHKAKHHTILIEKFSINMCSYDKYLIVYSRSFGSSASSMVGNDSPHLRWCFASIRCRCMPVDIFCEIMPTNGIVLYCISINEARRKKGKCIVHLFIVRPSVYQLNDIHSIKPQFKL